MKPIRLSAHALSYTTRRGFTTTQVEEAIHTSLWEPSELGRWQCHKTFYLRRNGMVNFMPLNKFGLSSLKKQQKLWL
jgi:hypothetical protein